MIQKFAFHTTDIEGLFEIQPFCARDNRGCFTKDFSQEVFEQNNIQHNLKEVFYTTSLPGVVRALHFQRVKQQPKLVRCIYGYVWDVVVDLRKDSKTFKRWLSFDLKGDNQRSLLIPAGCAHGYLVIEPSIVSYKCAEKFYGQFDDGIIWNDADIGVNWPLDLIGGESKLIFSDKDLSLQSFKEFCLRNGGGF